MNKKIVLWKFRLLNRGKNGMKKIKEAALKGSIKKIKLGGFFFLKQAPKIKSRLFQKMGIWGGLDSCDPNRAKNLQITKSRSPNPFWSSTKWLWVGTRLLLSVFHPLEHPHPDPSSPPSSSLSSCLRDRHGNGHSQHHHPKHPTGPSPSSKNLNHEDFEADSSKMRI